MKKLLLVLLLLPLFAFPQTEKRHRSIIIDSLKALNGGIFDIKDSASFEKPVGIGGILDASALLTLTDTAQGFLVPRMTAVQRNNIVSPATGLLVFDTDSNAFFCFIGLWSKLATGVGVGDMLKSAYDTNNDSIVNNADTLNGEIDVSQIVGLTTGDSSFVTLQVDTLKAFNNTTIQFVDSAIFQEHLQTNKSFTVNFGLSTFKGFNATSGAFVGKFQDNVGTEIFNIRNDGNIGIGHDSPEAPLDVFVVSGINYISRRDVSAVNNGTGMKYIMKNSIGDFVEYGIMSVNILNATSGAHDGFLKFQVADNGTIVEGLRVTGDGIQTPLLLQSSGGLILRLLRKDNTVGRGVAQFFSLYNSNSVSTDYAEITGQIVSNTAGNENGRLLFSTRSGGVITEKVRITDLGNMGINEQSPSAKLHIKGDVIVDSLFSIKTKIRTLGVGVTTFVVAGNKMKLTGDGGANTIATITGGVNGMTLTITFVDALITLTDDNTSTSNTINLSAAFTSTANDILVLEFDGTSWREKSRSIN